MEFIPWEFHFEISAHDWKGGNFCFNSNLSAITFVFLGISFNLFGFSVLNKWWSDSYVIVIYEAMCCLCDHVLSVGPCVVCGAMCLWAVCGAMNCLWGLALSSPVGYREGHQPRACSSLQKVSSLSEGHNGQFYQPVTYWQYFWFEECHGF